jgi:hypothetical protein
MSGTDDNDLFAGLGDEVPPAQLPLAGIPREVVQAVEEKFGSFAKRERRGDVTKYLPDEEDRRRLKIKAPWTAVKWLPASRWGIPIKETRWRSKTRRPTSLAKIANRAERRQYETIISHEIDGKLRTGASNLDHEAVVSTLRRQGYGLFHRAQLEFELIERFKLGHTENDPVG